MNYAINTPPMPKRMKRRKTETRLVIHSKVWYTRACMRMTQEELAIRSGVDRKTIYRIETGKSIPTLLVALRILAALLRPINEVFSLK